MQKIILIGNLGNDPELREAGGTSVTNLRVAVNRRFNKQVDEGTVQVDQVTWFDVSVWGKQAEACAEYLKKGRQVAVEGELIADDDGAPRMFERNDGSMGTKFEVRAVPGGVQFLGAAN